MKKIFSISIVLPILLIFFAPEMGSGALCNCANCEIVSGLWTWACDYQEMLMPNCTYTCGLSGSGGLCSDAMKRIACEAQNPR